MAAAEPQATLPAEQRTSIPVELQHGLVWALASFVAGLTCGLLGLYAFNEQVGEQGPIIPFILTAWPASFVGGLLGVLLKRFEVASLLRGTLFIAWLVAVSVASYFLLAR